ncbi:dephospho-CoA kinase [Verrucomicrobiota bacterium]
MSKTTFSIGITGGIACGKSETGRILEALGVAVCDADQVAHRQMLPGTPVFQEIVRAFGPQVLNEEGSIDRGSLGQLVFCDPKALQRLNAMVHPAVQDAIRSWLSAQQGLCAVMVPLLYEVGWEEMWDAVICVAASRQNMLERLTRRGFSEEESCRRIQAQMELNEKISRADYVIYNDGTLAELRENTLGVVERIKCERMQ